MHFELKREANRQTDRGAAEEPNTEISPARKRCRWSPIYMRTAGGILFNSLWFLGL